MSELDQIFVRALKLLHSRSKDELEQLKQMTDEAIAQRRGEMALKRLEEDGKKDDSRGPYKSGVKREYPDVDRKRESEKRNLEKLKEDLASMTDDVTSVIKKPKLELSESKHGTWKDRETSRDKHSSEKSSRESKRDDSDREHKPTIKEDPSWLDTGVFEGRSKKPHESSDKRFILGGNKGDTDSSEEEAGSFPGLDTEQFATDMMELACAVCKQFDQLSGNRLLDCQECHRLYHQECHRPPVSEDVDDPRFVWYCSKCSKNIKKMVKAQKPKSSTSSAREKETSSVPMKAFKSEASLQQPFKRMDTSKSSGSGRETGSHSGSGGSRPYTGLASLAANLSSRSHSEVPSKSRSTSETSSTKPSSSSKVDQSKGLGFLFKPDAHRITNLSTQKSSDKASLHKQSSTGGSSSKLSFSGLKSSNSSTSKPSASGMVRSSSSSSIPKPSSSSLSKTSSSSVSSSGSSGSSKMSSLMNADKKLQMMKKKAAARAAEKKSLR